MLMHWINLVKCEVVKYEWVSNVKFDITMLNDAVVTGSVLESIIIHVHQSIILCFSYYNYYNNYTKKI